MQYQCVLEEADEYFFGHTHIRRITIWLSDSCSVCM